MRFVRPTHLPAGFMANTEEGDAFPFDEAGEIWTPPSWAIGPHRHVGWEVYLQVKGGSVWRSGKEEHKVPEGGCYLVGPGVEHSLLRFEGDWAHFYFAVFQPEKCLARLADEVMREWPEAFWTTREASVLRRPFEGLVKEVTVQGALRELNCKAYLTALCVELSRLFSRGPRMQPELTAHPAAQQARQLIEARPDHPWKLDELGRAAGVSAAYLIEIFRRDYGCTPKQHIILSRLKEARRQLQETTLSVTEIALENGFASSQHLAYLFRKHFGTTPTSVRKAETRREGCR